MNRKKKDKKTKVESDEDNVYTAERLLKKRTVRNQVQYLVKWKDWSSEHNRSDFICKKKKVDLINFYEQLGANQ